MQRRIAYRDQKTRPMLVFGAGRTIRRGHAHSDGKPGGFSAEPKFSTAAMSPCSATAPISCCSSDGHRPDRQDGSRRHRSVHRRRRVRQAAVARQLFDEPGRFRGHSLHDIPAVSTASASSSRSAGGWARRCRSPSVPREGRQPGRRDRRNRAHHAEPPRPTAGRTERLRHRHAGRAGAACGIRSARRRSSRWSSSRRLR